MTGTRSRGRRGYSMDILNKLEDAFVTYLVERDVVSLADIEDAKQRRADLTASARSRSSWIF